MIKRLNKNNILSTFVVLISTSMADYSIASGQTGDSSSSIEKSLTYLVDSFSNETIELAQNQQPYPAAIKSDLDDGGFFSLPELPVLEKGIIGSISEFNNRDNDNGSQKIKSEVDKVLRQLNKEGSSRSMRIPVTPSENGSKGLFRTGKPTPNKRPTPSFTKIQQSNEAIHKKVYSPKNSHLPPARYQNEYVKLLFNSAANGDLNLIRSALKRVNDIDVRDSNGNTPLIHAVMSGNVRSVATLLRIGANANAVNKSNNSPLYLASQMSRVDLVDHLLAKGANPNFADSNSVSPLMLASERDMHSIIHSLVKSNANLNLANKNGDTALHLAVKNDSYSSVIKLINLGAYVNSSNKKGYTPLMLSAFVDNVLITEALLNSGGDTSLTDLRGRTALDIANVRNSSLISRTLRNYRGKNTLANANYVSKRSFSATNLDGTVESQKTTKSYKPKKIYYARKPLPVLKPNGASNQSYGLTYPREVQINVEQPKQPVIIKNSLPNLSIDEQKRLNQIKNNYSKIKKQSGNTANSVSEEISKDVGQIKSEVINSTNDIENDIRQINDDSNEILNDLKDFDKVNPSEINIDNFQDPFVEEGIKVILSDGVEERPILPNFDNNALDDVEPQNLDFNGEEVPLLEVDSFNFGSDLNDIDSVEPSFLDEDVSDFPEMPEIPDISE